jgi:hypothetical protein
MTPKEKAIELVNNVGKIIGKELKNGGFKYNIEIAKLCALKTVDEIINYQPFDIYTIEQCMSVNKYWQEVKQEIEKL